MGWPKGKPRGPRKPKEVPDLFLNEYVVFLNTRIDDLKEEIAILKSEFKKLLEGGK